MASAILSRNKKKFYITTPIYYVNDMPHIGHGYTMVAADVMARYRRLAKDDVFLLTGTDEHGAKIEERALALGQEPQHFVDQFAEKFKSAWVELGIAYDNFIRTSSPAHVSAVQDTLAYLYRRGDIYSGEYEGLYCRGCEQFMHQKDLADGLCPDHKVPPERVSEQTYMFKMSKYGKEIQKKIAADELAIIPEERKNEILSFYEQEGLHDVSFSRKNVRWGIPLPFDKSQTTYVWADAFLNYLTGIGWTGPSAGFAPLAAGGNSQAFSGAGGNPARLWPPDVQLMGKDILRVHATIWPAMCLALGLPLPKTLFVHGFFLVDGQKMSKSLGNVIAPGDLAARYGSDASRYLLAASAAFNRDADLSYEKLDEKYTAELANGLGNLVARSITLAEKLKASGLAMKNGQARPDNWDGQVFTHNVALVWEVYQTSLKHMRLDRTLEIIYGSDNIRGMVKFLDGYITAAKPWELVKNKDERAGAVVYNMLERLRHTALMILPFMPSVAEKIMTSLGLIFEEEMKKDFRELIKWGGLSVDALVVKGEILFPRITK